MKTSNLTKDSEKRQNFDFEIWRFESRNIFKTNNILNIIHFWFIVATLKCVRLTLQFHRFINVCAKWKTVIENAIKIDVFEFLRLMFRSKKNFLIRKNELFFIESVLSINNNSDKFKRNDIEFILFLNRMLNEIEIKYWFIEFEMCDLI